MLNVISTCRDILCVDINVDKRCVDHSTSHYHVILHSITMVSFMIEDTLIPGLWYSLRNKQHWYHHDHGMLYTRIHMVHNHIVITLFCYPDWVLLTFRVHTRRYKRYFLKLCIQKVDTNSYFQNLLGLNGSQLAKWKSTFLNMSLP